jgi:hypothetical protein
MMLMFMMFMFMMFMFLRCCMNMNMIMDVDIDMEMTWTWKQVWMHARPEIDTENERNTIFNIYFQLQIALQTNTKNNSSLLNVKQTLFRRTKIWLNESFCAACAALDVIITLNILLKKAHLKQLTTALYHTSILQIYLRQEI